jgi:hypothetical protein
VCLGIARALLHNEQWAEEILSDCALSATAQIGAGKVRADTAARFHAWLHKVIRFSCYRFLKRQKPELEWNETTANKQIDKFGDEDCQVIGVSKKCPLLPVYRSVHAFAWLQHIQAGGQKGRSLFAELCRPMRAVWIEATRTRPLLF